MSDTRSVKTVFVFPPARGPGGHSHHWMAWYEGDDDGGPRGWGDTAREAIDSLRRNPMERK